MKTNNNKISTKSLTRIGLMAALTVGFSFIRIAFIVPFTLQTLACMIAGLLLGRKEAFLSQALYVLLGLIGLPIFTAGGGFSYVIYPTFGYILFLPIMAWVISCLKEKSQILALISGTLPLLLFGMLYYFAIVSLVHNSPLEVGGLASTLLLSFIPAEILKATAALLLYRYLPQSVKKSLTV